MLEQATKIALAFLFKEERPISPSKITEKLEMPTSLGLFGEISIENLIDSLSVILSNPKDISLAIKTVRIKLLGVTSATNEEIEKVIDHLLSDADFAGYSRKTLKREIEAHYNIYMDNFRIIEAEERRRPWIKEVKSNVKWLFWNRYKDYLQIEKNFSDSIVNKLDTLTDRILDGLFNPNLNIQIEKYGLVVGQVQSGKTSNYTGLICKAADAGFKIIIVLAGIHKNLRSQTQLRIDEGFLGFDTQYQRSNNQSGNKIGVGRIDASAVAHSLTSNEDNGDFSAGAANSLGINFDTNEPIILVVKKNSSVLGRLNTWLKAQTIERNGRKSISQKSLLMIDDEADNASINTNKDDKEPTKINGHIRNILKQFDKRAYVGYTATPFANIFIPIDGEQIFPRDFIINIPAPSNYIGPDRIFGTKLLEHNEESETILPIVNRIDDYKDFLPERLKHNDNNYEYGNDPKGKIDIKTPDIIPNSLKLAIRCFILTCAIRRLRGQKEVHNSMLVHVARLVNWQKEVKRLVEEAFHY